MRVIRGISSEYRGGSLFGKFKRLTKGVVNPNKLFSLAQKAGLDKALSGTKSAVQSIIGNGAGGGRLLSKKDRQILNKMLSKRGRGISYL